MTPQHTLMSHKMESDDDSWLEELMDAFQTSSAAPPNWTTESYIQHTMKQIEEESVVQANNMRKMNQDIIQLCSEYKNTFSMISKGLQVSTSTYSVTFSEAIDVAKLQQLWKYIPPLYNNRNIFLASKEPPQEVHKVDLVVQKAAQIALHDARSHKQEFNGRGAKWTIRDASGLQRLRTRGHLTSNDSTIAAHVNIPDVNAQMCFESLLFNKQDHSTLMELNALRHNIQDSQLWSMICMSQNLKLDSLLKYTSPSMRTSWSTRASSFCSIPEDLVALFPSSISRTIPPKHVNAGITDRSNCAVIKIIVPSTDHRLSILLFRNGAATITGCLNVMEARWATIVLLDILQGYGLISSNCHVARFKCVMLLVMLKMPIPINLARLHTSFQQVFRGDLSSISDPLKQQKVQEHIQGILGIMGIYDMTTSSVGGSNEEILDEVDLELAEDEEALRNVNIKDEYAPILDVPLESWTGYPHCMESSFTQSSAQNGLCVSVPKIVTKEDKAEEVLDPQYDDQTGMVNFEKTYYCAAVSKHDRSAFRKTKVKEEMKSQDQPVSVRMCSRAVIHPTTILISIPMNNMSLVSHHVQLILTCIGAHDCVLSKTVKDHLRKDDSKTSGCIRFVDGYPDKSFLTAHGPTTPFPGKVIGSSVANPLINRKRPRCLETVRPVNSADKRALRRKS